MSEDMKAEDLPGTAGAMARMKKGYEEIDRLTELSGADGRKAEQRARLEVQRALQEDRDDG